MHDTTKALTHLAHLVDLAEAAAHDLVTRADELRWPAEEWRSELEALGELVRAEARARQNARHSGGATAGRH